MQNFESPEDAMQYLASLIGDLQSEVAQHKEVTTALLAVLSAGNRNLRSDVVASLRAAFDNTGNQFARDILDGLGFAQPQRSAKSLPDHLRVVSDEEE